MAVFVGRTECDGRAARLEMLGLLVAAGVSLAACAGDSESSPGTGGSGGALPATGGMPPLGTGGTVPLPATGGASPGTGGVSPATGGAPAGTGGSPAGTGGAPPEDGGTGDASLDARPDGDDGGGGPDATPGLCVGDFAPGDYPPELEQQTYLDISGVPGQQGLTRNYKVHVPPGYDCHVPAPVVFCLHGLTQNPVQLCVQGSATPGGDTLVDKSNTEGFILVMPLGHQNSWNGAGCCGGAASMGLDDVALMRAIFDEVATHVNVDRGRVFATGFSNGGYMSYRLACEAADLFVAVAPAAGGLQGAFATSCSPSEPVSVLDIHGTLDNLVPYSLQAPSMQRMAAQNGCAGTTAAATAPSSGGDTACVSHTGCPDGLEVTGCTITGGGHSWFGDPNCGTGVPGACLFVGANSDHMVNTDAIVEFFGRHSR